MDVDLKKHSLHVYKTLERIVSEETRQIHKSLVVSEILRGWLYSLEKDTSFSIHFCGSSFEGTTTPGMKSDFDELIVYNYIPVHVNAWETGFGDSAVIFQDERTKPGYFKIQIFHNHEPYTECPTGAAALICKMDRDGKVCLKNWWGMREFPDRVRWRHGPAETEINGSLEMYDTVHVLTCARIPDQYKEWIHRKREHGWPPRRLLYKIAKLSCFFARVGYEGSVEEDLEWRMSFSLQERELMLSLNPVQHKCYILMKMIRKDIIEPCLGETDIISSYHCKTCLFYAVENSPKDIWTPENLIQCLFRCLGILNQCVYRGNCANYFIPDSNMFDRVSFRRKRKDILQSLEEIMNEGSHVLYRLRMDNFGDLLVNKEVGSKLLTYEYRYRLMNVMWKTQLSLSLKFLVQLSFHIAGNQHIQFLFQLLDTLPGNMCEQNHTKEQIREALSYMLPLIHRRIATSFASLALETNEDRSFHIARQMLSRSVYHFLLGMSTDHVNTRLMFVAVIFKLKKYKMCKEILEAMDPDLVSVCNCTFDEDFRFALFVLTKMLEGTLTKEMLSTIVPCSIFLPSEKNFVPPPLLYEMYRSGPYDVNLEHWFYWAVVDVKVFLFFMQYMVYSKLNLENLREKAKKNIESSLSSRLKHPETAYNLLGWIHAQEHQLNEAVRCWKKSLAIQPVHNAAKIHIAILLFNIYRLSKYLNRLAYKGFLLPD